jgi:DNA-binding protein Fis
MTPSVVSLPTEGIALETVERDLVRQAMERTGGNQKRSAELLGIERDALRRRLIKFGFKDTGWSESA